MRSFGRPIKCWLIKPVAPRQMGTARVNQPDACSLRGSTWDTGDDNQVSKLTSKLGHCVESAMLSCDQDPNLLAGTVWPTGEIYLIFQTEAPISLRKRTKCFDVGRKYYCLDVKKFILWPVLLRYTSPYRFFLYKKPFRNLWGRCDWDWTQDYRTVAMFGLQTH